MQKKQKKNIAKHLSSECLRYSATYEKCFAHIIDTEKSW